MPPDPIWQLRISLLDVAPEIWRRVTVPSAIPLDQLHEVLYLVMGWKGYHLHVFENDGVEYRDALVSILARLGTRDDRILRLLKAEAEQDTVIGAVELSQYGDPAAIPFLSRMLDEFKLEDASDAALANREVFELANAIEELGGTLSDAQDAKAEAARARRKAGRAQRAGLLGAEQIPSWTRDTFPDRNDPCWCRSGKKYKHCHLEADQTDGAGDADRTDSFT